MEIGEDPSSSVEVTADEVDDDEEEAPIGEGLYDELVGAVQDMTQAQRMQLVNALQSGTPWAQLPQWTKNLMILLDS